MAKPVITQIAPFDSGETCTVTFTYGGNQVYKNTITVYKADDLSVVYTHTVSSMMCNNTIAGGTLTNGVKYCCEIVCYDKYNNASSVSDKAYFWVYSKPSFYFDGIESGDIIKTSSPSVNLVYAQNQFCDLYQYQFFLYDSDKGLVGESEIQYEYTVPCYYTYQGLDNNETYYLRALGETDKGVICDTGYIEIFTKYRNPTMYALVYASSDDEGVVDGYTNFKVIPATRNDYQYVDGYIQLQDDVVIYNTEINFSGDLLFGMKFKNTKYDEIFMCKNENNKITLTQVWDDDNQAARFRLTVYNEISEYVIYSDPYDISGGKVVTLWIERYGHVYGLKVNVYGGTES